MESNKHSHAEERGVKVQLSLGPLKYLRTPREVSERNAIFRGTDAGGLLGDGYGLLLCSSASSPW